MGETAHLPLMPPFELRFSHTDAACAHCNGLPVMNVESEGVVIGVVSADWPWNAPLPDDPAAHPDHPHYEVEWYGQTPDGRDIPGIRAADPYFIARAIAEEHLRSSQA